MFLSLLNYKINNWFHYLFFAKAAALNQQISKFCPQIKRTEASYHIFSLICLS